MASSSVLLSGPRTAQATVNERSTQSSCSTTASISWLWWLTPLMMMTSLTRPVMNSWSSRMNARSPLSNQPSAVNAAWLAAGLAW